MTAARSKPYYADITHPDANKGGVVRYLSDAYDIPAEQIATIGDMPNDVLMFAHSGLSIAMGNASHEVQEAARRDNARRFFAGHRIQLMVTSDDQPKDVPALLDYRHPPVGTTTRNTIHAGSRLLLPVLAAAARSLVRQPSPSPARQPSSA